MLQYSLTLSNSPLLQIRNVYTRTNMLICRFNKCSTVVKIRLFRSYCICIYGAGLWSSYSKGCLHKLKIGYHRCIKMFFGYSKMHSVSAIQFDLGLPSFDTLMHNYRYSYREQWLSSLNAAIVFLRNIGSIYIYIYMSMQTFLVCFVLNIFYIAFIRFQLSVFANQKCVFWLACSLQMQFAFVCLSICLLCFFAFFSYGPNCLN